MNSKRNMSQKQRLAAEIETKIRDKVDSGEFQFTYGYIMEGFGNVKCRGCAISACAFAVGGLDAIARDEVCSIPKYDPRITINDIAQLEMGFENWSQWVVRGRGYETGELIYPSKKSAFYRLGQKLRAEHPEY
jgi:hypothetical protein